jgi:serine phosphatase RsbU (regulator of sigma subunit)/anti-sigma regulatory factor (Ser/Thr protein kinase)
MFRNVRKELIAIPAQMSYLGQVRDFIDHIGKKYKYEDRMINSFKLVIEEACTNIIRHGYRDIKGGEITIKAIIRRQSLTIVVVDQGISYDPRQAATPDLEKYIQIGKKGGLGIFMMRKLMDDVQYNITSRGNELRLTKMRESIPQTKPEAWWDNLTLRTRHTITASAIITLLALLIFSLLYFQIDENNLEEAIFSTRAQTLSMADNSSEYLQRDQYLDLFSLAHYLKKNSPDLIYETFIVDSSRQIISGSTPLKSQGLYQYPENVSTIAEADTLSYLTIYKYSVGDTLTIYDFAAEIHTGLRGEGDLIGWAHVWVPEEYIGARADQSKINLIIYLVIILLLSYVGSYFLIDRIVTPFHSLADWVRQVGQGTIDEDEIDIDASDELGEIAQAFNLMTNKFREAQVNVIEQQRLQKELQVAQEIQQMLLPSDFPQVKGYELASYYEAAKEVGGDLFDFVEVDSDTIGICVADVAGKGVPGSLIMTMIRTALRLEARGNKNPAEVLSKVNRFVTDDMKRGMFVTMFYLVLDSRNRIIHYASAGHNPMILYRGSTKQTYYLNPSGFPVGIQLPDITLFDQKIQTDSIRLREDDLLMLYTDGVTEAMNPKRELYREERFLDVIRRFSNYDVSEFIQRVKEDIKHHTQGYPQNDDITFVSIKEKLMQGEVIYAIQKELFRQIEDEHVPVRDACEQMQVSAYMYRKYKKIKDEVGWEGLKEFLYDTDYIEKKHISIEVKTKLFEIVRTNPEFGPKRISDELNTEKFGFTMVEPRRIYDELKRARLTTAEKREAFVKRGGRKRIKLPGTPLLTMDGQVILNYESAEKVISEKRGTKTPLEFMPPPSPEVERRFADKQLSSKRMDETGSGIPEIKIGAAEGGTDAIESTTTRSGLEEPVREKLPEPRIDFKMKAGPMKPREVKPAVAQRPRKPREKQPKEKIVKKVEVPPLPPAIPQEVQAEMDQLRSEQRRLETIVNLSVPAPEITPEKIDTFYGTIQDDLNIIQDVVASWSNGDVKREDLTKILLSLKIIATHHLLRELTNVRQLFTQVINVFEFLTENIGSMEKQIVLENAKEILKYIKKENILSNIILEQINEIGIKHLQIREKATGTTSQDQSSDLDSLRKKIASKNLLKNKIILETLSKSNQG